MTTSVREMPPISAASPYPWPYDGNLDAGRIALVLMLDPEWRVARESSGSSDKWLLQLAATLQPAGVFVVAVTRCPLRSAPNRGDLIEKEETAGNTSEAAETDTATTALLRPLAQAPLGLGADVAIEAGGVDAFYASALDATLQNHHRSDLILAGWGLEGPVHSTMRSANDRGYECLLVADASVPCLEDLSFACCEMVRFSGGIFGAFASSRDVIDAFASSKPDAVQNSI